MSPVPWSPGPLMGIYGYLWVYRLLFIQNRVLFVKHVVSVVCFFPLFLFGGGGEGWPGLTRVDKGWQASYCLWHHMLWGRWLAARRWCSNFTGSLNGPITDLLWSPSTWLNMGGNPCQSLSTLVNPLPFHDYGNPLPFADAKLRHRAYNLWVAVWWYGLEEYDFWRTGFVNGTICCAYFKRRFRPKT